MAQDDRRYTDPRLRRRLHDALLASSKGGRPGQWSARKSQLLVQAYERAGGGYTSPELGPEARSLRRWSRERWQTASGRGDAEVRGRMHRYLPADAWTLLPAAERRRADRSKTRVDVRGRQRAPWPDGTRRALRELGRAEGRGMTLRELRARAAELGIRGRSRMARDELVRAIRRAGRAGRGPRAR
jgi:hypothetical protein